MRLLLLSNSFLTSFIFLAAKLGGENSLSLRSSCPACPHGAHTWRLLEASLHWSAAGVYSGARRVLIFFGSEEIKLHPQPPQINRKHRCSCCGSRRLLVIADSRIIGLVRCFAICLRLRLGLQGLLHSGVAGSSNSLDGGQRLRRRGRWGLLKSPCRLPCAIHLQRTSANKPRNERRRGWLGQRTKPG